MLLKEFGFLCVFTLKMDCGRLQCVFSAGKLASKLMTLNWVWPFGRCSYLASLSCVEIQIKKYWFLPKLEFDNAVQVHDISFKTRIAFHIDQLRQPTLRAISLAHVVRTSVRTHFSNLARQNNKNNVCYWRDCGSGRVDHWWHLSCLILNFL